MHLANERSRTPDAGKADSGGCGIFPQAQEGRLEWWLLSGIVFTLWLLPWQHLLLPKALQILVRGVIVAIPLAWVLKVALPANARNLGYFMRTMLWLIILPVILANRHLPLLTMVLFTIHLCASVCLWRRDNPTARIRGREIALSSEITRSMVVPMMFCITLLACLTAGDPVALTVCVGAGACFCVPDLRDRFLNHRLLDLQIVTVFLTVFMACREELTLATVLLFFLMVPVAWFALFLEPARSVDGPGDARDRRRRLLVTLAAAQYLLFPDMLARAAGRMFDSGSLAGVERLAALYPASGELRGLRDRFRGTLGLGIARHERSVEAAQAGTPAPRETRATTAAVAAPPARPVLLPFSRLTAEAAVERIDGRFHLTFTMHLSFPPPPEGFANPAPAFTLPGWSALPAGPSGEARFTRRYGQPFDPEEGNFALMIHEPMPVPAGFAVERPSVRILGRGPDRFTLHAATDDFAATLHAGHGPVEREGAPTALLLTASAAPPVTIDCAGCTLTVHAAGWAGLADRFGKVRRGIERLAGIHPLRRRSVTVFLGGFSDIPLGGFAMKDTIWVTGGRAASVMPPHLRHVLHDDDPAAPYDSDERLAILMHELVHALTAHPRVMHGQARLYEGIVTYLAERIERDGPDDFATLAGAWTGRVRPGLALDETHDWNAFCEASYLAGRDLFRAVEHDLGPDTADRLIRRLFAHGPETNLRPLLRAAYAGRTPHPVVGRLLGPLDPFAPPDAPAPAPDAAVLCAR